VNLKPGDSARDKLARAQKFVKLRPGNVESALALARAAIDAQAFDVARTVLEPLLIVPTQRVALLMAELEEAEHNDAGRARAWTARAVHAAHDPVWTADGYVSETWMAISPVGRLDAFEWKVPVAELPGVVIEDAVISNFIDAAPEPVAPAPEIIAMPAEPTVAKTQVSKSAEAEPKSAPVRARPASSAATVPVETIIPLVHAPDDPGLDDVDDTAPLTGPRPDGGRKLRDLFK